MGGTEMGVAGLKGRAGIGRGQRKGQDAMEMGLGRIEGAGWDWAERK